MTLFTKFLALTLAFTFTAAHAAPPLPSDLPDLVEKIMPGVVNISSISVVREQVMGLDDFFRVWGVPQERQSVSRGSGFIIDNDGYVITNNHVVQQAQDVVVTFSDKRQYHAKVIGKDLKLDIALLQLRDDKKAVPPKLTALALGNSDSVRIAETAIAIGNPFGLSHSVSAGIISAKNRTIGVGPLDNFLQTDASINPGNSGGPLFNLKGEVIGINTVIFSNSGQSAGVGFAIPINEAKLLIPELKKSGRVPRPWLGILGQQVSPPIAFQYGLSRKEGVLIYNLVDGGPADQSGIRSGDIIFELDGEKTDDLQDLERALFHKKPREKMKLSIQRGTKVLRIEMTLKELPARIEELPKGII